MPTGSSVLLNLSGRGDKDVAQVRSILGGHSVSSLDTHLQRLKTEGRKAFVPYLMAGAVPDWTRHVEAAALGGADAIEIGIPFSDPMMDGVVIQEAALRALDRGATLESSAKNLRISTLACRSLR